MFNKEDLKGLKAENEKNIAENKAIILEKQKANFELEAENRVFDKLIKLYFSVDEVQENVENVEVQQGE